MNKRMNNKMEKKMKIKMKKNEIDGECQCCKHSSVGAGSRTWKNVNVNVDVNDKEGEDKDKNLEQVVHVYQ